MCHGGSHDDSPAHGVKTDGHSLAHAARPVIHQDDNRGLIREWATRCDLLDPVSLYAGLSVVWDSVSLVGQHGLDESSHDAERYRTVAAARDVAQVQNEALRRPKLLQCGVEGCDGLLIPE